MQRGAGGIVRWWAKCRGFAARGRGHDGHPVRYSIRARRVESRVAAPQKNKMYFFIFFKKRAIHVF